MISVQGDEEPSCELLGQEMRLNCIGERAGLA